MSRPRTAVVTGASSGIGRATAGALADAGFELTLAARRLDRLREVAAPLGAEAVALDVTDTAAVAAFSARFETLDLLVNNAGAALGLERLDAADEDNWRRMWDLNVMGVMRMTRGLLPALRASGGGHVVNVGSTSCFEVYPGGAGYTASKHGLRAVTRTLRLELLGEPVRVTEVSPGHVKTEFALVRFEGDRERADGVYEGMTPLAPEDVAEAIRWAVTRPPHVNVDEIVLRCIDQATSTMIHRRREPGAAD